MGNTTIMQQLDRNSLSQLIQERLEALDRLHELKNRTELIESEIRELVGGDFDPDEFFAAAGFAAQDDIEAAYGKDEWTPLGSMEDTQDFVSDLINADDDEAERLAPQYFAENIIIEEEDGSEYCPEAINEGEIDWKNEKSWKIKENLPIEVFVKKSWTGRYYVLEVPTMKMSYETFTDLDSFGKVDMSSYDYHDGEASFTANNLNDIKDWAEKNKGIITVNYSKLQNT